jgi:hypothetical protein
MPDRESVAKKLSYRETVTLYDPDLPGHQWAREVFASDDPVEALWARKTEGVKEMHRQTADWILAE